MRCAIISDIHGNLDALGAVLDAVGDVDALYCAGDVVGYGAEPNECCEVIRERAARAVLGNHDAAAVGLLDRSWFNPSARAAAQWTSDMLTEQNRRFLSGLAPVASAEDFMIFHGTIAEPMNFHYIASPWEARALAFSEMGSAKLAFFGHTHIAEYYAQEEGGIWVDRLSMTDGGMIELKPGFRYVINVGSVGQPRDGNAKASAGIYDRDAATVQILRVEYNIASAQRKIEKAGLPEILARRLALGM